MELSTVTSVDAWRLSIGQLITLSRIAPDVIALTNPFASTDENTDEFSDLPWKRNPHWRP